MTDEARFKGGGYWMLDTRYWMLGGGTYRWILSFQCFFNWKVSLETSSPMPVLMTSLLMISYCIDLGLKEYYEGKVEY